MENEFQKDELENSLRRAFVDKKAKIIIVDGQTLRSRFLRESISLGLEKGLISQGEPIDEDEILGKGAGQYYALTYELTKRGREYFGII